MSSFFLCLATIHTCGVSLVYNLRIAETTRRQTLEQHDRPSILVGVLVNQYRETKNDIHQFVAGGLATYIRTFKDAYFRIDGAVGHIDQDKSIARTKTKRTQTDDILCSLGHGFSLSHNIRITVSGLLGIPTHNDTILEGVQFGTGHSSVGIQGDFSWFYSEHTKNSFMGAVRFVHFFSRKPATPFQNLNQDLKINLGNLIDILIAHQCGTLRHKFECGYSPSFGFGANITPPLANTPLSTTFIRSNFYANYKFLFLIQNRPSVFGLGLSYGFDHKPKDIGLKKIITVWGAWGINF